MAATLSVGFGRRGGGSCPMISSVHLILGRAGSKAGYPMPSTSPRGCQKSPLWRDKRLQAWRLWGVGAVGRLGAESQAA